MSRSIELGRAVLYLPTTNLELWLTTSLTFSPQESADSIGTLKQKQFLDVLSSGQIWVSHGVDMHANLCLTHLGEAITEQQLDALAQSIVMAPVWEQLLLQPSLPDNSVRDTGIVRLNIRPAIDGRGQLKKQGHDRPIPIAPIAKPRPPEGTPVISLDSVHLSLIFLESSQRTKRTNKRQKRELTSSRAIRSEIMSAGDDYDQKFDISPYGIDDFGIVPTSGKQTWGILPQPAHNRSRRSQISDESPSETRKDIIAPLSHSCPIAPCLDQVMFEQMVDGGFRLSVSGSSSGKSLHGLKVKANTFRFGLADLVPTMWRPGYLHWFWERTRFLPQIGRSLNQVASLGVIPADTLAKLTAADSMCNAGFAKAPSDGEQNMDRGRPHLTSVISRRLWVHLAKVPPKWSTTSLQSFVTFQSQAATSSDAGDLFEEIRQNREQGHEADLHSKGNQHIDMSNDDMMLHSASQ